LIVDLTIFAIFLPKTTLGILSYCPKL